MSILNILTRQAPKLAGYQFDAVLEDSFEASIELTSYPVESGVKVADHRIIQPVRYYMVGSISNNPLKVFDLVGLAAGGLSNLAGNNPYVAAAAGLSAGFLAGNQSTRASSALEFLLELLAAGLPFDVDAVDIQLKDMVLTRVSRDRDPENENGLIFVAEMQELIQLSRLDDKTQPNQDQLADGDPAKSGAAADANSGQQVGEAPSPATAYAVNVTDGITQVSP
ncbi:phage baseplate protein [Castellaniella ginsengisoli]|uniref:Phage baseplate protein n=1 Tax=Castellaniella ginsengisoli TaxID=546114 RepID=A0AB39DVQ4_9BURK